MIKMNLKILMILVFLGVLIIGGMLINACIQIQSNAVKPETQFQIIENIAPEEAYILIQKNKDNKKFVILDVRTPEEFSGEHIENAVNLDYYSDTFRIELGKLNKNKIYLIYCRSGRRSENALNMMKELDFREVYNMLGGINSWKAEGLPTTK